MYFSFFFFNDTSTTEIYTLSLHDALPISDSWMTVGLSSVKANTSTPSAINACVASLAFGGLNQSWSQRTWMVACGLTALTPKAYASRCRLTSGIGKAPTYPTLFVFVGAAAIRTVR